MAGTGGGGASTQTDQQYLAEDAEEEKIQKRMGFLCVCRALTSVWGGKNSHKKVLPPPLHHVAIKLRKYRVGLALFFFFLSWGRTVR